MKKLIGTYLYIFFVLISTAIIIAPLYWLISLFSSTLFWDMVLSLFFTASTLPVLMWAWEKVGEKIWDKFMKE